MIIYSASESLSSGSDFNRLNWRLTGSGSQLTDTGNELRQLSGTADVSYAITHDFALLGTGGYTSFSTNQTLTQKITGIVALGGFRLSSGPRLHADFRAGEQFNRASYVGDINYQVTPLTTLIGSLSDSITTPAAGLLGNLGQLGVNNQGNFYNTNYQTGQNTPVPGASDVSGFNPAPLSGAAVTDVISRYRSGTASLIHIADRMQYRLTGFWIAYDPVTLSSGALQQTSTGGDFSVSRNINPFLSAGLGANYAIQHVLGAHFSTITGTLTVNYQVSVLMQVYFRTAYISRLSSVALVNLSPLSDSVSDTAITIGIRRQL